MRKYFWLAITILFLFLVSFAEDSNYPPMAIVDAQGQLWLYGFGAEPRFITTSKVSDLVWNADGHLLAFAAVDESGSLNIMLLNIDNMSIRQLNPYSLIYYPNFPLSFSLDGKQVIYADYAGMNDSQEPDYWLGFGVLVRK